MTDCPNCEYHRQRAQRWREEAYKQAGHPLPGGSMNEDLINRITYYLSSGGLFNPELADHLAVRNLLMECRDALAQPEQKPVVCKECHLKDTVYDLLGDLKVANLKLSIRGKRTLIGLTDEEREQVINANTSTGLWHMAKDIEAKLKEKNSA
jgi:hypothetical protein